MLIESIFDETFLNNGQKPILSIIGGAKVSSKIEILNNLINVVDDIIIAGGMAYTFIKSMGGEIGNSLCEDEFLKEAKDILFLANRKNVNLHFPEDVIVSREISKTSSTEVASIYNIPTHMEGLDIGPKTLNKFSPTSQMIN